MSELAAQKCDACRADAPRVTPVEMEELKAEIPEWEIVEIDGIQRIRRRFSFDDFVSALRFTNQVGEIAEAAGHHPAIVTEWGKVTVSWWTHKIRGLHRNDFIMAARTDRLKAGETDEK